MTPEDIPARDQVFLNPWLGDYLSAEHIKHSELARAIHIDASVIHLWATGQRPVPHNRLEQLAAAFELDFDEIMAHARIQKGGYEFYGDLRPAPPAEAVRPVVRPDIVLAEVVPALKPKVAPSEYRLLWCRHGPGSRLHHHGYEQVYGPVGTIAEWSRERDPVPYVRPQAAPVSVAWPARRAFVPPPVSEPPVPEATESTPDVILGRDVLIDPSQWKDDQEIPFAPPLPPTEEVQRKHVRRAQVRRVREVIEAETEVTPSHRGHLALGIACSCVARAS